MSIEDMKHVTVEQVLALRDEAIKLESQRDKMIEALRSVLEDGIWTGEDWCPVRAALDNAEAALKAVEE